MPNPENLNKILNDKFVINLKSSQENNSTFTCAPSEEFGSINKVRFITSSENNGKETKCDDCDAHMHLNELYELNFDNPEVNLIEAMKILQDSLVFVLETVDWKVGD